MVKSELKHLELPCHCTPHQPRPESDPLPFNKDSNVVIIGAGPAGIHMGHLLKKRGYSNVKILEKADDIGGKSFSLIHPDSGLDVPHEMGTCFMHPGYKRIFDLADSYGFAPYFKTGGDLYDKCNVYSPELNKEKGTDPNKPQFLIDWMFSDVEKQKVHKFLFFLPDKLQILTVADSINRYEAIHKAIFGEYEYTLPPRPDANALKNIDMTFLEFIHKHSLEALIPIFLLGNSAQGYGLLETIPAFYGLWWNSPVLLKGLLEKKPLTQMFQKGFQNLWKTIAVKDELDIVLKSEVVSIDRHLGSEEKISIKAKVDGEEKSFECDFLIISAPLKHALSFLGDATEEEKELFGCLKSASLITNLIQTEILEEEERATTYMPERLSVPHQGRFYAERNSFRAIHPEREVPKDKRFSVAYQYMESFEEADAGQAKLLETLQQDLKEFGYKESAVVKQMVWEYFPKYSNEEIKKLYPWKVLDLQGKHKTWYAGSSACFESAEDVVAYNHLLLKTFNME